MSRFILRQIARNQSTKDIVVDRTATIQAEPGAAYQLLDARSMKPVSGVVLKRRGDALVVEVDGEIAVAVERFYGSQAGAVFEASGGGGQVQVVTEATVVPELGQAATPAGGGAAAASGAGAEPLLAALTIGGLGLLSSSGGSAAAPVENTVVAKVVAGPVVKGNDLIAMIYAADDKTLLGQGAINEDGTVTVKVGSYTGVVVVKVKNDQNPANDHVDYMDEATGVSKDLGDVVLSSMGEIVTLNGVITLNVNILTALAYHEAAEAAKGAPLTAPLVRDTNAAVAKAFGLESLTEGDIKTIVDQGGNASSSNKYGELLAALSGADKNNGGSVKATLDALINAVSVTGTTATLTPAVTTLLSEGAKVVDPANSKGLLSTVQSALQSSSNTTPSTPPSTPVTTDTTPPVASVTTTTISRTGSAQVQSNEPGTAYLVQDTVAVTNLASITSAAGNVWNSVALSAANTATSLAATGLVDGTYRVYAVDAAGNLSTATSNSITIDSTRPVASVTAATIHPSTGNAVVQSTEPGTAYLYRSSLSVTNLASITSAPDNVWNSVALSAANTATSLPATGLVDGNYWVSAVDAAGNMSSPAFEIEIDTTGPVASVAAATILSTGDAQVWSSERGGTAYLVRDTVAVTDLAAITSAPDNVWNSVALRVDSMITSLPATGLVDGTYRVYAVDAAGNLSLPSSGSITITPPPVELANIALGAGGFVINGQAANDWSGYRVASAGDVNGDGLADLIVGAYQADPAARSDAGKSYVVFGKSSGTAIDLSAVEAGTGGFVINGQAAGDRSGESVASAGDVNGDGLADLIVGSRFAAGDAGKSYVVFGKSSGTAIDLSAIEAGTGGFVIKGGVGGSYSGFSVASAGDMNGDGLADLIVGAFAAGSVGGQSYVVFGKSSGTAIDLSAIQAGNGGGFVINGQAEGDQSGFSVASAGDVNGDGLADLIVGARFADTDAGSNAGKSYVIFGSTTGAFTKTTVDELGTTGNDALSDGGAAKTLVGGAGDDSLSATAASVLYGGSGKDSFQINAAMITALRSPLGSGGNVDQLARIDGGTGVDAIVLSGASLELDLTQIANQSASNTNGSSRINSIEAIDLTGTGNNTLKLKVNDLFDMTGFNNFAATGRRQLLVKGDTGDAVDLADGSGTTGWTQAGTQQTIDSVAYNVWNHNTSLVTLYVAPSISVI